jgi:hypothetical protein
MAGSGCTRPAASWRRPHGPMAARRSPALRRRFRNSASSTGRPLGRASRRLVEAGHRLNAPHHRSVPGRFPQALAIASCHQRLCLYSSNRRCLRLVQRGTSLRLPAFEYSTWPARIFLPPDQEPHNNSYAASPRLLFDLPFAQQSRRPSTPGVCNRDDLDGGVRSKCTLRRENESQACEQAHAHEDGANQILPTGSCGVVFRLMATRRTEHYPRLLCSLFNLGT